MLNIYILSGAQAQKVPWCPHKPKTHEGPCVQRHSQGCFMPGMLHCRASSPALAVFGLSHLAGSTWVRISALQRVTALMSFKLHIDFLLKAFPPLLFSFSSLAFPDDGLASQHFCSAFSYSLQTEQCLFPTNLLPE